MADERQAAATNVWDVVRAFIVVAGFVFLLVFLTLQTISVMKDKSARGGRARLGLCAKKGCIRNGHLDLLVMLAVGLRFSRVNGPLERSSDGAVPVVSSPAQDAWLEPVDDGSRPRCPRPARLFGNVSTDPSTSRRARARQVSERRQNLGLGWAVRNRAPHPRFEDRFPRRNRFDQPE